MADSKAGRVKYEMSLEHLVIPESKKSVQRMMRNLSKDKGASSLGQCEHQNNSGN